MQSLCLSLILVVATVRALSLGEWSPDTLGIMSRQASSRWVACNNFTAPCASPCTCREDEEPNAAWCTDSNGSGSTCYHDSDCQYGEKCFQPNGSGSPYPACYNNIQFNTLCRAAPPTPAPNQWTACNSTAEDTDHGQCSDACDCFLDNDDSHSWCMARQGSGNACAKDSDCPQSEKCFAG